MRKYTDYLADKEREEQEKLTNTPKYEPQSGCDECIEEISYLRNLIEDAYDYMTLNTYKQKVPKKTIVAFKETMSKVSEIVRRNKDERNNQK